MVDSVEVRLGADTADAKSGMQDASSSIATSLQSINSALDKLTANHKGAADAAVSSNKKIADSFLGLHETAVARLGSINSAFIRFRDNLVLVAGALAGGALFRSAVSSMLDMEGAVRGLVIAFGMSTQAATQQAIALKLAGVSAETYQQMGQRVGRVLKTQSDEFDRLGVVTKDASGNLLPMEQILQNVYARMQDFKAGTDQTEFALSTVGRNATDFASDMERLTSSADRAAVMMAQLNIQMGPDRIAQIERYRQDLNAFNVVLETIGEKVGETVLPKLEGLAAWFNDVGPRAIGYIVDAVKTFLTVMQALGSTVATIGINAIAMFQKIGVEAVALGKITFAAVSGDWTAIPAIIKSADDKIEFINKNAADSVVQIWSDANAKIKAMWTDAANGFGMHDRGVGQRGGLPGSGKERFTPKPTGGAGSEPDLSGLENKLKSEQDAFNKRMLMQGSFQTWSITQTRDYWEKVLATTDLSAKQRQDAENRYYDAERQVQQQSFAAYITKIEAEKAALGDNIAAKIALTQTEVNAVVQRYGQESAEAQGMYKRLNELQQAFAKQQDDLLRDRSKFAVDLAAAQIAGEQEVINQELALHRISADQMYAIEEQLEDRLYALKHKALEDELAEGNLTLLQRQQINEQIVLLEVEHQNKLTQIANAAVLEREKYALQANDAIKSSLSDTISSLISNTKNWKQTLLDAFRALDDQLVKIASNKIVDQLFGAGTGGGDFLSKITGQIFGGGAGGATGDAAHTAAVAADTAATTLQTTTSGVLNTSFLALITAADSAAAAMAAMSASGATSGLGGGIGSLFGGGGDLFGSAASDFGGFFAEGTNYVPRDMLAIIHKGEAVVPSRYNTGDGAAGSRHVSVSNTFLLATPVDGRTQNQIAREAARSVHRASRIM